MTVGELLDRISSHELTEWMALHALEGKEHDLVTKQKVEPDTAYEMVWGTDADLENEE